jgi:hypothetical protein
VSSTHSSVSNEVHAMRYALFTEMALSRELPERDLRRGDIVRIISDHLFPDGRPGYSIEVCNAVGDTVAVTAVDEAALEPLNSDQLFTVRRMTAAAVHNKTLAVGKMSSAYVSVNRRDRR